jgi:CheY-like chemotaxis protein
MPTLLLADASPMMHRIVELTFAHEDIRVVGVRDGEQAIARIAEDRPDVVFADHAVPKRSGYEVVAFVKGRPDLAHIPVVLLTGAFEPVDKVRAAQVGCDGVLVKPFEPREAVERVRELLERAATPPPGERSVSDVAQDDEHAGADDGADALPTVDALLGEPVPADALPEAAAADASPTGAPAGPGDVEPPVQELPRSVGRLTDLSELADALSAMARRDPMPPPVVPPLPSAPAVPPHMPVSEELVDEVTRRVLERLAPGAVDRVVYGVVSRIAERLLREEIERRGSK